MTTTAVQPGVYVLDVVAANGVPFRVLAIPADVAGPNRHRAPAGRGHALVEFYDRRSLIDREHGQFTGGCYHLGDLLDGFAPRGLDLAYGVDAWTVDSAAFGHIRAWLRHLWERGVIGKR